MESFKWFAWVTSYFVFFRFFTCNGYVTRLCICLFVLKYISSFLFFFFSTLLLFLFFYHKKWLIFSQDFTCDSSNSFHMILFGAFYYSFIFTCDYSTQFVHIHMFPHINSPFTCDSSKWFIYFNMTLFGAFYMIHFYSHVNRPVDSFIFTWFFLVLFKWFIYVHIWFFQLIHLF